MNCNFHTNPHVRLLVVWLVGRSVSFLKGRIIALVIFLVFQATILSIKGDDFVHYSDDYIIQATADFLNKGEGGNNISAKSVADHLAAKLNAK